jgi:hypothetical protein
MTTYISSVTDSAYLNKGRNVNLFNNSKHRHFVSIDIRLAVLDSEVQRNHLQIGRTEWSCSMLSTELWDLK